MPNAHNYALVPAKAGIHHHGLWNMGPQHKRGYARLLRAMRGDDAWKWRRAVEFVDRLRRAVNISRAIRGRYCRSFGFSAALASPPCGGGKAAPRPAAGRGV